MALHATRRLGVLQHGGRAMPDLVTLPNRPPIISYGPPGRSAVTGHVATVFGCTGFLGRYLVAKLAKAGTQVIVPYREEDDKRHLKVTGDLGQIVPMAWDLRSSDQIAECVRHSDTVYNLVGRDYETKNFDYTAVHVSGAARIAAICAQSGVSRLFHISHLNAALDSPSAFYRSKAEGEEKVLDAFESATIVRPSAMFGHEDRLLNSIASTPGLWKLNDGQTKIRPVNVLDVAQALTNMLSLPAMPSLITLPGPVTHTFDSLLELVNSLTFHDPRRGYALPKKALLIFSKIMQRVWWPVISPDEIERRYIDDVGSASGPGTEEDKGDWDLVGVNPEEVETSAIVYLRRYRSAENYARPAVLPNRAGPDSRYDIV